MSLLSQNDGKLIIHIKGAEPVFFVLWCEYTVIYWLRIILGRIPIINYITPLFFQIALTVSLLLSCRYIIRKLRVIDLTIFVVGILVWITQKQLHPEYLNSFEEYGKDCLFAFCTLFIGRIITTESLDEVFFETIYRLSLCGIALTSLYLLFGKTTNTEGGMMTTAYYVLPSILCVITMALHKTSFYRKVLLFICILLVALMGTRGALLAVLIYIGFYYVVFRELSTKKIVLIVIAMICLFIIGNLFDLRIVLYSILNPIARIFHLSSRIPDSILSGTVLDNNGRSAIQEAIWRKIIENPWGYGLFSDRYITNFGFYVHNFVLELWVEFGVIFGSIPLLFILFASIKTLRSAQISLESKFIISIYLCVSIVKLSFSGTWVYERYFYILIGILLGSLIRLKRNTRMYSAKSYYSFSNQINKYHGQDISF